MRRWNALAALCAAAMGLLATGPGLAQTIATTAGNGSPGFSGDNNPAKSAQIDTVYGAAVTADGKTYLADSRNQRIREVVNGTISTVAGTGLEGYTGDHGPATAATLSFPRGVAVDAEGNLYIADTGNSSIRKVTAGVITTVAGNGAAGFAGDSGLAVNAQLSYPAAIAIDSSGNIYIADTWNYRIREISTDGKIQTIAGNGSYGPFGDGGPATSASLGVIESLALDAAGNLYLSDVYDHVVRKVAGGTISTVVGGGFGPAEDGGPAGTATLMFPKGVAVDWQGNLFISDSLNYRVREVTPNGVIGTTAGTGTPGYSGDGSLAKSAQLNAPSGLAVDPAGDLTISDQWNYRVRTVTATPPPANLFVAVAPCRVVDTRNASGEFGGPTLEGGTARSFPVPESSCGIPASAQALSLNITVVPSGPLSYLTVWPTGQTQPFVSTLNSMDGQVVANAAIVPAGTDGAISVYVTGSTDVVIDIDGYFTADGSGSPFHALTPCRVADTRNPAGPFGGPSLAGGASRSFPFPSSGCSIPATAQAYSLNATVVPQGPLGYLTLWPAGETQPFVSTLNSPEGQVVANAALVPAGALGAVSAFATDRTDLILDVNGYFGTPASGALSFFPIAPCRVVDTRLESGELGGPTIGAGESRDFPLPEGDCGIPPGASAYSLNVTVVPQGPLPYLTLWPTGESQPLVSTLNSMAGQVVANAAIVPAGTNGSVSVYVAGDSDVILDINGYFAAQ